MLIAIVPARSNSKRLKNKNFLKINNKSLTSIVVENLFSTGIFDKIIVSSENENAKLNLPLDKCSFHLRKASLAKDTSTVVDVCIDILKIEELKTVKEFLCIYPTAININPKLIINSYNFFNNEQEDCDYLMGVSKYNHSPFQALIKNNSDFLEPLWPDLCFKQSQEFKDTFVSNGSLYWAKSESFLKDKSFYGKKMKGFLVDNIDINYYDDFIQSMSAYKSRVK